jgi:hypothetical protein
LGNEGIRFIADSLQQNSVLQDINLSSNNIGPDGAFWISKCLEENSALQKIDLRFNNIGDDGIKWIAGALPMNSSLLKISIDWNKIGSSGAQWIANGLQGNYTLMDLSLDMNFDMSNISHATNCIGKALMINSTLQRFSAVCNADLEHLKVIDDLIQVNIEENSVLLKLLICLFIDFKRRQIIPFFDNHIFNFYLFPLAGIHRNSKSIPNSSNNKKREIFSKAQFSISEEEEEEEQEA